LITGEVPWRCAELIGRRRDSDPGVGDPRFWVRESKWVQVQSRPRENWARRRVLKPVPHQRHRVLCDYEAVGIELVKERVLGLLPLAEQERLAAMTRDTVQEASALPPEAPAIEATAAPRDTVQEASALPPEAPAIEATAAMTRDTVQEATTATIDQSSTTPAKPPGTPAPAALPALLERELVQPKVWFAAALKEHKRKRNESKAAYAARLATKMSTAPVIKQWKPSAILRRMFSDNRPDPPRKPRNLSRSR
jgi:hypothetical protein